MSDVSAIVGECKKCGPTTFTVPEYANDAAWITCNGCGQLMMTWAAYKASARKSVFDEANDKP